MKILFLLFCIFLSFHSHGASYHAYGLKMRLLSADIDIMQHDSKYEIKTQSKARGMLSLFIHAQSIFNTSGTINNDILTVQQFFMQNKDKKNTETVHVDFTQKPGFMDYQSALLHLMRQQTHQTQELLVSDGKRDMKITFLYEGAVDLAPIYKNQTGIGQAYSVRIDILQGKKSGWFFKRVNQGEKSPLTLYFKDNQLALASFDTGVLGTLYIVKEAQDDKNTK